MTKASLSGSFPHCASVLAEFRKAFGAGVTPVYFEESGRAVGKPLDESRYTVVEGKDFVMEPKDGR